MSRRNRSVITPARVVAGVAATAAALALWVPTGYAGESAACASRKAPVNAERSLGAPSVPATSVPASAAETAGEAGMRAFIDPVTGQLREPTAEEAASLNRFVARAFALPAAPQFIQHANGMLSAQLGEEYMNDVLVRRNGDGTLSFVCVPHPTSEHVLNTPAPPKSPELEKE